jgi:hypothetical protein
MYLSAPNFPTSSAYVLPWMRETNFYTHTKQANQNCIREEMKNRLILGMPTIKSSRVSSSCLLFKNEVHRTTTLMVEWGWPTGSALGNLGQGRGENCMRGSLWLVLCTGNCVGHGMRENWVGRAVAGVADSEMPRNTQEDDYMWNLGVDGRIILKQIWNVWAIKEWSRLLWL